jgi:hypothetical protein
VDPKLFDRIVNQCVAHGQPCMSDLMKKDMEGMAMGPHHGHHAEGPTDAASDQAGSHPPEHAGIPTPSLKH